MAGPWGPAHDGRRRDAVVDLDGRYPRRRIIETKTTDEVDGYVVDGGKVDDQYG